jgi:hypothetical protein
MDNLEALLAAAEMTTANIVKAELLRDAGDRFPLLWYRSGSGAGPSTLRRR